MASGQTVLQIQQTGPCQKAKKLELEFFVNPNRCPGRGRPERTGHEINYDDTFDNPAQKKKQYNDDETNYDLNRNGSQK
jgi:hypothetical protein